jgi:Protein of unknown function (DUF1475)
MVAIRTITFTVAAIMVVAIGVAVATGDLSTEGGWLLDHPWGRMTLIDLYAGIVLFAGWVILRRDPWWVTILWVAAFVVLGNAATASYAFIAAMRSPDIASFLLGERSVVVGGRSR